jgi:3-deoxy-D-manno-octulosonate 8-phosphate phosphatase (KDO 8-P phosphatase)
MATVLERARRIRLVSFDVDGVLTDGRIHLAGDGSELKVFHVRDGHGIKLLGQAGIECAIISGRRSPAVARRMRELGVRHLYQGVADKVAALSALLAKLELTLEQVAHVGDDVPDLPLMRRVGLAVAVQDADPLVKRHAHWQTGKAGGKGAAREVCELVLDAQDRLQPLLDDYLSRP